VIEFVNISKSYGRTKAVSKVSFHVPPLTHLAVLGPSGSGKTTLLRLLSGLERPDGGRIVIEGEAVSHPSYIKAPHKRNLAMIFQGLALWPHMTVREHLEFALKGRQGRSVPDDIPIVLTQVALEPLQKRYPHQLSGGERQRLAIARALVARPSILLMDEPFSHLDFLLRREMTSLLMHLREQTEMTMVYVSHNLEEALALADEVLVLQRGVVDFFGKKEEMVEAYPTWFDRAPI
jgi:iron(III) transport system ATP-binding protein